MLILIIFFKVLIEMIFHFVLMVIIMVTMVGGVNGFDLLAVGQMDYCELWVKHFHNKSSFLI